MLPATRAFTAAASARALSFLAGTAEAFAATATASSILPTLRPSTRAARESASRILSSVNPKSLAASATRLGFWNASVRPSSNHPELSITGECMTVPPLRL